MEQEDKLESISKFLEQTHLLKHQSGSEERTPTKKHSSVHDLSRTRNRPHSKRLSAKKRLYRLLDFAEGVLNEMAAMVGEGSFTPQQNQAEQKVYQCPYCENKYAKPCSLGGHVSRVHIAEKKKAEEEEHSHESASEQKSSVYIGST